MKNLKILKSIKTLALFSALLFTSFVSASNSVEDVIKTFRNVSPIEVPAVKFPTVVEVPVSSLSFGYHIGVYDSTKSVFVPHLFLSGTAKVLLPSAISSDYPDNSLLSALSDDNYATSKEFDLPETGSGRVTVSYKFTKPIRSSSLQISLDQFVALPTNISIVAVKSGSEKIILSNIRPNSSYVSFPETVSDTWKITLSYSQPLRVNELTINNLDMPSSGSAVRFLAEPNHSYDLYFNPELILFPSVGESANLNDNTGVVKLSPISIKTNPAFKEADSDEDGIPDATDNCVRISNTDQKDEDGNGRGDVCDDFDRDGIANSTDNCVNNPNQNQRDIDNDGLGDICDGEESRLTEKYPILVWIAIGFAVLAFASMFFLTFRRIQHKTNGVVGDSTDTKI